MFLIFIWLLITSGNILKDDPNLPLPNAKYSMTLTKPSVPELDGAWKRAMRYLGVLMSKIASTADKRYLIVNSSKGLRVGAKVFEINVSVALSPTC